MLISLCVVRAGRPGKRCKPPRVSARVFYYIISNFSLQYEPDRPFFHSMGCTRRKSGRAGPFHRRYCHGSPMDGALPGARRPLPRRPGGLSSGVAAGDGGAGGERRRQFPRHHPDPVPDRPGGPPGDRSGPRPGAGSAARPRLPGPLRRPGAPAPGGRLPRSGGCALPGARLRRTQRHAPAGADGVHRAHPQAHHDPG